MFWRQAYFWAKEKGYEPLRAYMDQLHIKTSESEKMICYDKEDILMKGWCNTNGFNTGGLGGWGFCSESCKFLKHKVDREQSSEDFNKVCTCRPHYSMPINSNQLKKAGSTVSNVLKKTEINCNLAIQLSTYQNISYL